MHWVISEIREGCLWHVCELPGCLDSSHLGMLELCPRKTAPAVHPWAWPQGFGAASKDRAKPVGCSESGGKWQQVRDRAGWGKIPFSFQRNMRFKFITDQKSLHCFLCQRQQQTRAAWRLGEVNQVRVIFIHVVLSSYGAEIHSYQHSSCKWSLGAQS